METFHGYETNLRVDPTKNSGIVNNINGYGQRREIE
jgi:hypothetical protein